MRFMIYALFINITTSGKRIDDTTVKIKCQFYKNKSWNIHVNIIFNYQVSKDMQNKRITIMAPTRSSKYLPIFFTKKITIDQGRSKILLKSFVLKRANQHGLKESDRGSPKEHFYKKIENWPNTFGVEDLSSFHYSHIRPNSPAPWRPCFFTNQHGL